MQRESMEVDVVIVGAGPAGLSTACRLLQLADEAGKELSVCVLEKGSEVVHIFSQVLFLSPLSCLNCSRTGKREARRLKRRS